MRIYYVMEAEGRRHHVHNALDVDARAWNRLYRRASPGGIPPRRPLRGRLSLGELASGPNLPTLSCSCCCHVQPSPSRGADLVSQALRIVEDFAVETGGVLVINVWLDWNEVPHCRQVALNRLFNHINATVAHDDVYALVIFGQVPDEMSVRTYERLRNHSPVPVRHEVRGDGWHTRNLPIDRIIGGPAFRSPNTDCLLQVAGVIALALVWREEPIAGVDFSAFAVLDRALNRRDSRHDPQGVGRR